MAEINLQEIHDLLVEIAYEAGRMMMVATPSYLDSGTKKNCKLPSCVSSNFSANVNVFLLAADLVTETDRAVEKMVSNRLLSAYPSYSFIGEETYVAGQTELTDAPTFICDPVDGTTNFVHAFPAFCISLGFTVQKVPSVGVIYNPFLNEVYTGIKGQGSFVTRHTGEKLQLPLKKIPEPLKDLSTCLVGAEWGSDRAGNNFAVKCKVFEKLAASKEEGGSMVHSLRCVGSAAINLAYVATGQQDVFWEGGCWAWDVAAGWCILVEAGGIMVSGNPGDWKPTVDGRVYLAVRGAPTGQKEIVKEFWGVIGDERLKYET